MTNKKTVHRRVPNSQQTLNDALHPLLCSLYRARGITHIDELEKSIAKIHAYHLLKNSDRAVELLYDAMVQQKKIIVIGDFDADGATSTALVLLAMRAMGYHNISYLIPDRFKQGYGLSVDVVKEALNKQAELIITVDNGISSFEGVDFACSQGIQTIITDHHLPAETLPDATVIVNPNMADCSFPSKSLAGVGVAFYLMLALRAYLRQMNWFTTHQLAEFNLAELLDLVAVGTIADLVPLDYNNRILVHQGLNRIRAGHCRVGMQALLAIANKNQLKLTTNDLGFTLAPRLNAAGRLDDMSIGVELLICDNNATAQKLAKQLDDLNIERKKIEQSMKEEAAIFCEEIKSDLSDASSNAIVLYHHNWHQGVIGILASRLKEQFSCPVIIFADVGEGLIKGSARSIHSLHIKDALALLNTRYPDLICSFGGHAMAAGLTLKQEHFTEFKNRFEQLLQELLDPTQNHNIIFTDGEIDKSALSLETAEMLQQGGPWGQGFPEPLFDGCFTLLKQQLVADKHLKVLAIPAQGGPTIEGIIFNIDRSHWPNLNTNKAHLVYRLDINEYKGQRKLQLMIDHIWAA